jgi:hypothetical protein
VSGCGHTSVWRVVCGDCVDAALKEEREAKERFFDGGTYLRAELARVTADAEGRIASREREMVRLTEKLRATTEEGDDTIRGLLELNDAANLRAETAERELAEARAERVNANEWRTLAEAQQVALDLARARVAELEAEARVVVEDQSAHSSLCEYLALDGSPCDCRLKDLSALVPPDVR